MSEQSFDEMQRLEAEVLAWQQALSPKQLQARHSLHRQLVKMAQKNHPNWSVAGCRAWASLKLHEISQVLLST